MSFDAFDIASSGMYAQRVKMDTIASNIANVNTTRNPDGTLGPYRKKEVAFSAIYDDKISRGPSNFSNNATQSSFNPATGQMTINSGISMNDGNMSKGVRVDGVYEAPNPIKTVYDPSHPDADAEGYVNLPNVNVVEEMVGMVTASKAYEANAMVAENIKTMMQMAMRI